MNEDYLLIYHYDYDEGTEIIAVSNDFKALENHMSELKTRATALQELYAIRAKLRFEFVGIHENEYPKKPAYTNPKTKQEHEAWNKLIASWRKQHDAVLQKEICLREKFNDNIAKQMKLDYADVYAKFGFNEDLVDDAGKYTNVNRFDIVEVKRI